MLAVGKRSGGKWSVRVSLWRYLLAVAELGGVSAAGVRRP